MDLLGTDPGGQETIHVPLGLCPGGSLCLKTDGYDKCQKEMNIDQKDMQYDEM